MDGGVDRAHAAMPCRSVKDLVHILFASSDGVAGFMTWPPDTLQTRCSKLAHARFQGIVQISDCGHVAALESANNILQVYKVCVHLCTLSREGRKQ